MAIYKVVIVLCFCVVSKHSIAQYSPNIPPPVDLGIQNISQQTQVWCWAAVAQQIIAAINGPQNTPQQCVMVAIANNASPQYCCNNTQGCMVTGSLQQIQSLIAHFGGRYSSIAPPADPMTIYNALASGKAIIMAVRSSPYSGHVVVIRGMHWIQTRFGFQPVLLINDPMSHFTQPVPFQNLAAIWQAAILVY
ncbi:papain-like cysteine protease family protein [Alteromonas sp. 1_MG-2023]|uniref:papain-like cysteine protease family protein n=1 Tax=Alteromonas sp. 1_MG-2023 TaxID=3062669 RepID=UPI0026E2DB8D|nr:papain-like cysteine protease family protein [Alteromonas sp. 1_MG-2023]MDO6568598.1 papain-like cysteine protease family protein [Alteromonas sp. 1_MG-2023]